MPGPLIDALYRVVFRVAYRLHLVWAYVCRPACEGVWVAIWCDDRLLVIRNAYRRRLTLPGGGIDRGEEAVAAAVRELWEEVGIELPPGTLRFAGQYQSRIEYKRDTINVFETRLEEEPPVVIDRREVVYAAFVEPASLQPEAIFPALSDYIADTLVKGG